MSRDKWRSAPRVEGQIPQVEAQVNTGAEGGGKRDLSDGGKGDGRTQYRKWEVVTPCTPPLPASPLVVKSWCKRLSYFVHQKREKTNINVNRVISFHRASWKIQIAITRNYFKAWKPRLWQIKRRWLISASPQYPINIGRRILWCNSCHLNVSM